MQAAKTTSGDGLGHSGSLIGSSNLQRSQSQFDSKELVQSCLGVFHYLSFIIELTSTPNRNVMIPLMVTCYVPARN